MSTVMLLFVCVFFVIAVRTEVSLHSLAVVL
jgi:hypothetical protein